MAAGEEKRVRRKATVAQVALSAGKPEADAVGSAVRPRRLEDFVGQEQLRRNLTIFIKAALSRKEPLDHCLLYGPPGLGKTTLAQIIAVELGVRFKYTSGPALTRAGDLASILASLRERDVLFIDEIHRLPPAVEEGLYAAMEDFLLPIILERGRAPRPDDSPQAIHSHWRDHAFGMLSAPLRDRFGIIMRMDPYNEDELAQIIAHAACRLNGRRADCRQTHSRSLAGYSAHSASEPEAHQRLPGIRGSSCR